VEVALGHLVGEVAGDLVDHGHGDLVGDQKTVEGVPPAVKLQNPVPSGHFVDSNDGKGPIEGPGRVALVHGGQGVQSS
jgi:hypothetical protein